MNNSIFKTFLLSLCIIANTNLAYAQTASILPPAKTQFLDNSAKPLTSGTVDFYIPSTTTRKTTWQDAAKTTPNANPVVLDAGGRGIILGDGAYRQVVKDRLGNIIWDAVTSSTGSSGGGGPTATGDGDLVGTIKPWAGMSAPNQYAFTYGQELNRTTYAVLFAAITSSQPVFCNSASPILSGLTSTDNFWIGMSVEVSCVAAGFSTVISKTSTSVTLATNANVTTNTNAIFFPWGRGNGSTTFNLPDFRGFAIAGNNMMGGVASSILTTTYFGATNPNSSGAAGGSQSNSVILTHTHGITDPGHTHVETASAAGGASNYIVHTNNSASGVVTNMTHSTASATTGIIVSNAGSAAAHSIVQPTKTSNYIIKITPDANSATASGVTSIQGMTGDITCGANITCTGNVISISIPPGGVTSLDGATGAIAVGVGSAKVVSGVLTTNVLASRAYAATLDLSSYTSIKTLGYATPGDGGGATFVKVSGVPFKDTYILTGTIAAGAGYTNGTYLGVPMGGGVGIGCIGKVTVAGGVVTAVDLTGGFCNGYAVGNVLTPLNSAVGGTGGGATYTVSTISSPTGSFTDAVGALWQYVVDEGGAPNGRQFGIKADWAGTDGTATNDLASFKSAMAFMSTTNGSASAIINGGTFLMPKGAAYFCASPSQFATLQIPNGVIIKGAGVYGGTTLKQCTVADSAEHFVSLCDPNSQFGQFGCRLEDVALIMTGSSASGTSAIYSNSGQQFPLITNVYIQPVGRQCIKYEIGKGGASNAIFEKFDCEVADTTTNVNFSGNSSGTQIIIRDAVFGCAPSLCALGIYAVNMQAGNFIIQNTHIEQHRDGINVATSSASQLSKLSNLTIVSGCVNGITLQSTNPNNTVLVENVESSCSTATVLNGHTAGSNVTGNILAQRVFNP